MTSPGRTRQRSLHGLADRRNGNFLSQSIGGVSGTSTVLEQYETTFNQDLNGDGKIGVPTVVIQTDGSTSLVQVGANYFFNPLGGGTGPEFKYNGAAVTAGEFGTFTPIGAVQTASGYDVAWKNTSSGLYTIWLTDSNGNFLSQSIGAVSGTSTALRAVRDHLQPGPQRRRRDRNSACDEAGGGCHGAEFPIRRPRQRRIPHGWHQSPTAPDSSNAVAVDR